MWFLDPMKDGIPTRCATLTNSTQRDTKLSQKLVTELVRASVEEFSISAANNLLLEGYFVTTAVKNEFITKAWFHVTGIEEESR